MCNKVHGGITKFISAQDFAAWGDNEAHLSRAQLPVHIDHFAGDDKERKR
jgi:hypothetical protein